MASVNYQIGDFISRWRVAKLKYFKIVEFENNVNVILPIIKILYDNGIIRSFTVNMKRNVIIVYLKYSHNILASYELTIVSTPGHRVFWSLRNLSLNYNRHNFRGFYIISTKFGLKTSTDCLFNSHIGGEVLLKVEV